jgi:protein TonB
MRSNSLHGIFSLGALVAAFVCDADGQAQLGGTVDASTPVVHSVEKPIVEVRGETPYVELNGKEVAVPASRIKFYPSNGPFPYSEGDPPAWVFSSNAETRRKRLDNVELCETQGVNRVLEFSVYLESPTLLKKVWILIRFADDTGDRTTILHEVGTLQPFKRTLVTVEKRPFPDFYADPHVDWNVFANGREVFHSMMGSEILVPAMSSIVSHVREGAKNLETEPYLTFPPRDSSTATNPVKLELDIDRRGSVTNASVADSSDPQIEKSLLDAVKQWWFLPKCVDGRSVDCQASVLVDLPKWKTWSNGCVTLRGPSRSVASKQQKEISTSVNLQEQSGPFGSASRSGIALPVVVFQVLPAYSEQMIKLGIEGKATIEFFVQADGTVRAAKIVSQTGGSFGMNAVECVKQWKFRPALRDGVPVGIRMTVPIVFTVAGCMPASPFDGYYDQAYLTKQYLTRERAQAVAEIVAGLKYPVSLSEFYASLGSPGGQIGVLRRFDVDQEGHVARYQLNALDPAGQCYNLIISYVEDQQGSFANPRVKKADVVLAHSLPAPSFKIEEAAGASPAH